MRLTLSDAIRFGIGHLHPEHPDYRGGGRPPAVSVPSGPWSFTVPNWHPTGLNQLLRLNRYVRNNLLTKEADLIATYARMASIPEATVKRRVTLCLVLQGKDKRRDQDNVWKGISDHLVKAQLLVDDSPDWVVCNEVEYERASKRATRITLEDAREGA